jgi:hypothetical protein
MSGKPIRKTQAISPFGPGAIVDFPGPVSMIHAGLDAYPFDRHDLDHQMEYMITDEARLAARLGVDFFVEPMEYRPPRRGIKQKNVAQELPFLRFPLWHMCPRCGILLKSEYHRRDAPKCRGPIGSGADKGKEHPERVCYQVRFVAVCERGHITDFPWCEWISPNKDEPFEPVLGKKWLRLNASGSASLSGITVMAEGFSGNQIVNLLPRKTLGNILGGVGDSDGGASKAVSPLGRQNIVCSGDNPVLGVGSKIRPSGGCGSQLYVLLKNASNLYFPNIVSSIFIPSIIDASAPQEILDATQSQGFCNSLFDAMRVSHDGLLDHRQAKVALKRTYPQYLSDKNIAELVRITNTLLIHRFLEFDQDCNSYLSQIKHLRALGRQDYEWCCDRLEWEIDPGLFLKKADSPENEKSRYEAKSELDKEEFIEELYRSEEYKVFTKDIKEGSPKVDLDVSVAILSDYPDWIMDKFVKVSLLNKLRETRAFTGYNRLVSRGLTPLEQRQLFTSNRDQDWLPGIIVRGEGIFIEFSEVALEKWYQSNIDFLRERERQLTRARARYMKVAVDAINRISAKKVMIHTFSHILINELIYDCGYGSASLRERMYFSERTAPTMNAVLIYTAAGDTEGSMGGLVRQGLNDRLPQLIESAILRASWCSSDPVCLESSGQGPAGMNMAACHSCALLPETSCESMNLLLDRTMLVGSLTNPEIGFFSDLATAV